MAKKRHKKKGKGIFGSVVAGWREFEKLSPDALASLRNFLMFALIADLLLVIGFMKKQQLGIFLFLVIIIFLVLVLMNERRQNEKMMDEYGVNGEPEEPSELKEEPTKEDAEAKTLGEHRKENTPKKKEPLEKLEEEDLLGIKSMETDFENVKEDIQKSMQESFNTPNYI